MTINCLKCYRVHKCGTGVYFCPFFGLNPCLRGKHYVPLGTEIKQKPAPQRALVIPAYKPPVRKPNSIDWQRYHVEIFTRLFNGEVIPDIAAGIGVNTRTLQQYVERY